MAVYGRTKPYPNRPKNVAICGRCGGLCRSDSVHGYCTDCISPARRDGWIQ